MDYSTIKRLSSEKGISLKSLAESVGITAQGFHGYVKKNTMPINILEAIAEKLNVSLLDLIGGSAPVMPDGSTEIMELLRENRELRLKIEKFQTGYKNDAIESIHLNEPTSQPKLKSTK